MTPNTTGTPAATQRLGTADWLLLLTLAAINFLHIVDFVIIMPLGNRLMNELELVPEQFGYIVSSYAVAAMIATLVASVVIDRFDRKWVLLVAFAGFSLSTFACGLADGYLQLLGARALAGIFGGLSASAILAVIGDRFHDARRGTATGVVMSAFAVASIIGLPAGLWLAAKFGRGAPFLAIAILGIPVWIMGWMLMPNMNSHRENASRSVVRDFKQAVSTRRHLFSFAFMFTLVMGTFTIIPFLAVYMERNVHRPAYQIPWIYMIAGFCTFFSMNIIGPASDKYGKRFVFRICGSLAAVATLIITNLPEVNFAFCACCTTLFMITASGRMVPAQAMMIASATPAIRGAFVNVNSAVQHLAMSIAPMVSGWFMSGGNDEPLIGYPVVGAVALSFSITSLILSQYVKPAPGMVIQPQERVTLAERVEVPSEEKAAAV